MRLHGGGKGVCQWRDSSQRPTLPRPTCAGCWRLLGDCLSVPIFEFNFLMIPFFTVCNGALRSP